MISAGLKVEETHGGSDGNFEPRRRATLTFTTKAPRPGPARWMRGRGQSSNQEEAEAKRRKNRARNRNRQKKNLDVHDTDTKGTENAPTNEPSFVDCRSEIAILTAKMLSKNLNFFL